MHDLIIWRPASNTGVYCVVLFKHEFDFVHVFVLRYEDIVIYPVEY